MSLVRANLAGVADQVERIQKMLGANSPVRVGEGADPCADERAVVELATSVRDTAETALALAEAALMLAEQALMECEANNG